MAFEKLMRVPLEANDLLPVLFRVARQQGIHLDDNDADTQAALMLAAEELLRMLDKLTSTLSTSPAGHLLGGGAPRGLLREAKDLVKRLK